jgi:peptidoglycan/xylan/chitin deacetylase (PgdA/CDA1 family)
MRLPKLVRKKRGLRNLVRTIRKGPFTILLFHSVGRNAAAGFLPAGLDCEPGFFRSVLKMLAAEATVLSLHDLIAAIREKRVPPNAVVITFDDGYRDTLTVAWPMLKAFGFPAIVFPPTDAIGSNELLPLHALYYHKLLSGPHMPASDTIERGHCIVKLLREPQRAAPAIGRELYLNWDELRTLRAEGMEIGGHTCSHTWLAALTGEEQQREIADCKAILEKNVGQPIESFAYPFGYYDTSFTNATLEIVRRHFAAAVASVPDAAGRVDLLQLPRLSINQFYNP